MKTAGANTRVTLKNVLFLTDFSEPSEAALPFAVAIAREYGATVHALHVLTPTPYCIRHLIGPLRQSGGKRRAPQLKSRESERSLPDCHLKR
jgi:hypothetical protein